MTSAKNTEQIIIKRKKKPKGETNKWTIQRYCPHWAHKTQNENKQNAKNTTQKTKKN